MRSCWKANTTAGELGVDIELLEEVLHVVPDGHRRNEELLSDRGRRQPLRETAQDLFLACRQTDRLPGRPSISSHFLFQRITRSEESIAKTASPLRTIRSTASVEVEVDTARLEAPRLAPDQRGGRRRGARTTVTGRRAT